MALSPDDRPEPGARPAGRAVGVALMLAFVALVHVAWWLAADTQVRHGDLADGDSYIRLVRVERLVETGGWFDSSLPRVNPPAGGSLHWTRPFDVLLLALALPLMPALGLKAALFWSGAVIGPLLHLGAAAALAWAAAPLIGGTAALVAGGLSAIQFGVLGYAVVGHADHHVLLGLIAVVAFGFTVRALLAAGIGDGGVGHALAAGVTLALGTWVGLEMQIPMALAILALGLPWLAGEEGAGTRSLGLGLGLTGGLVLALLVERGPAGFFAVEHDRVSVVHLTQAALVTVFWSVVASLARRRRGPATAAGRLLMAACGAAMLVAVMRLAFPKILIDPLKDFDPVILAVFDAVSEYMPIDDPAYAMLYLGAVLPAAPWAAWRLKEQWAGRGRWPWMLLLAAIVVYAALALAWVRWSLYACLFAVVAVADLLASADARLDRRLAGPRRLPAKVAALALLAAGPLALGTAWVWAKTPARAAVEAVDGDPRDCPVQPLARFLEQPPWSDRTRTVLMSANMGAELVYRTRHRVTATLHHRNAPGIVLSIRILDGVDDDANRRLIDAGEIDLVVVCTRTAGRAVVLEGAGARGLGRRLAQGAPPPWLAEVALPGGLGGRFRMFAVRR